MTQIYARPKAGDRSKAFVVPEVRPLSIRDVETALELAGYEATTIHSIGEKWLNEARAAETRGARTEMDDESLMEAVAAALRDQHGVQAEAIPTGGNIWCVLTYVKVSEKDGARILWGTASERWGGSLYPSATAYEIGDYWGTYDLASDSEKAAPADVAAEIAAFIAEKRESEIVAAYEEWRALAQEGPR